MTIQKKLMITSATLTTLGVLGMVPYVSMWAEKDAALASTKPIVVAQPVLDSPTLVTGKPVHLSVPSLGIDLDIADGSYNAKSGEWTLSNDKAHFAAPTVAPNNEEGNTLIYGHNRRDVFASLGKIHQDAQAFIITDNGYQFTYTFSSKETVEPNNVNIFAYQGAPRLTLQTCSGTWYQDRQFFYFAFTSYEKI